jgi:predicted ATPase/class 3 adenylate cyclase
MDQAAQSRVDSQASSLIPSGTVTFLFTDIEGSTERWEHNRQAMKAALARHDELLNARITANGGYIFKKMGDAYCAAFRTAPEAAAAAVHAQQALAKEDFSAVNGLNIRMAIHAGYAEERDRDYFGPSVNRVSRLLSIGHGGQMLVSAAASDLVQGELPAHVSLRALGAHRLKDLAHPEQVFQLVAQGLPSEFPPLRSLDSLPNNLPLQVTSFIGRDEDVTEVKKLLERTRVLTLTGSGGVGKTRLALQAGAEVLEQHPDGVWLVDLAGLQDSELVISEVASVLGVRVGADRSLADSIVYALKPKRSLIILDNCEHLITAAAHVASAIVKGAPNVRVMTTSREDLGIAGETIYRVSSLAVPKSSGDINASNALQFGSIALFVDRATAANTRFKLNDADAKIVADICRSLDGIPFAIELASARVKLMSIANLAERLKERFRILTGGDRTALPRQQTMRALIDWSYNLLNEPERTLLNRTAVFAGGWTLESASEICSDEAIEPWAVLDLLSSLVDKSLVVVELGAAAERYRLLESTWQYAREKLAAAGESEMINRKHANYYLNVAEQADEAWPSTASNVIIAQLEAELDNFRAAMDWALTKKNDVLVGAGIAGALGDVWRFLGSPKEGARWAELAIEALADSQPSRVTTKAWLALSLNGGMTDLSGQYAAERALADAENLGDRKLMALAQLHLGFAFDRRGKFDKAEEAYIKAVPLLRETGLTKKLANGLSWWAILNWVRGNRDEAHRLYTEALALAKSCNDEQLMATVLGNLAELAFTEGDFDKAIAWGEEALAARRTGKNLQGITNSLTNLAAYRLALGQVAAAKEAAREAIRWGREAQTFSLVAFCLQHLAVIAARQGQAVAAAQLLGYVENCVTKLEFLREPTEKWSLDQLMPALRQHLTDEEIKRLGAEGATWAEDRAIEEALKI